MKNISFFVIFLVFFFSHVSVGALENVKTSFKKGDGRLVIYSYHLDELIDVAFRKDGKYEKKAIKRIENIFRSRLDNKIHPIDIELIELIDLLQDHFHADQIELISGYRSTALNKKLKEEGKGVANESLHMKGQAADIHIDEIDEAELAKYARSLNVGGVGYYPDFDFVHIDTGRIANWNAKVKGKRKLIGINPNECIRVTTDKNKYHIGDRIQINIENIAKNNMTNKSSFLVEFFRRGKWKKSNVINVKDFNVKIVSNNSHWIADKKTELGRYRIKIKTTQCELPSISNEFYIR